MNIINQNEYISNDDIIKNNFALLYRDFELNKNESNILVITSWVYHSSGKYQPFGKLSKFRACKYNFTIKVILSELFISGEYLCLRVKILHVVESEIPNIKKNDHIMIKINKNILLNEISYITTAFTSNFMLNELVNNTIKLYDYEQYFDIDGVNYLSIHQDDEDDPKYFDLDELKEKVNNKLSKDLEQLELIKQWIHERKDIYQIIKELKKFIRELENN